LSLRDIPLHCRGSPLTRGACKVKRFQTVLQTQICKDGYLSLECILHIAQLIAKYTFENMFIIFRKVLHFVFTSRKKYDIIQQIVDGL